MQKPEFNRADLPTPPHDVWHVECYGQPVLARKDASPNDVGIRVRMPIPAGVQLAVLFECAGVSVLGIDTVVADTHRVAASTGIGVWAFVATACAVGVLLYGVVTRHELARMVVLGSAVVTGFLMLPTFADAVRTGSVDELGAVALWALHAAAAGLLYWPRTLGWFQVRPSRSPN